MTKKINFVIGLHCHQPVGNFDFIFAEACDKSYEPFLTELERHPSVVLTLHISGCLLEWLEEHRKPLINKIRKMVAANQIEIMGSGFYEPVLTMLPKRDRVGQITAYRDHLAKLFDTKVTGSWITERVWEQGLVTPLAESGVEYFCVDDIHFKSAGVKESDITGPFITEDEGYTLKAFASNEKLRYAIPFKEPSVTVETLRSFASEDGERVLVYADDGEKFGMWPGTYNHLYRDGWLGRFFEALEENSSWLRTMKFQDACQLPAAGKVYLPDGSYREMTEWALPSYELEQYEELREKLKKYPELNGLHKFLKCGFWRNFKVKYPESNLMYSRMLEVSGLVEKHEGKSRKKSAAISPARRSLYRAQCNCPYWHGVFGGLYLPHLRSAIYQQLIAAEKMLDAQIHNDDKWISSNEADFDCDGQNELVVKNSLLAGYFKPGCGAQMYELDLKEPEFNIQASLARRHEAYHKLLHIKPKNENNQGSDIPSIHNAVNFKQAGLGQMLQYDWYQRSSFIDHFFATNATPEQVAQCTYRELGDFVNRPYDYSLIKDKNKIHIKFAREGAVWQEEEQKQLKISKEIIFSEMSSTIDCHYELENLDDKPTELVFGVEFNFALLAGDADDRYYMDEEKTVLGNLSTTASLESQKSITVRDDWQKIGVELLFDKPANIWTFPIKTVSQSEGGIEQVFQSAVVIPRWQFVISPKENLRFKISYKIECGKK